MKLLFAAFLLALGLGAADNSLFWDFSQGISPQNSALQFRLRGCGSLDSGSLYSTNADHRQAGGIVSAEQYPELTPGEAFHFTVEFTLEAPRSTQPFLLFWDNKCDFFAKKNHLAKDHSGFTIGLYRSKDHKTVKPRAWLGFGTETADVNGKPVSLQPGKRHRLEFDYDGTENAVFHINGILNTRCKISPGGFLAPARYKTAVGDRILGNYFRFDGRIHSLRLTPRQAEKILIRPIGRQVFLRDEKHAAVSLEIRNLSTQPQGDLPPHGRKTVSIPVETALTPGSYSQEYSFCGTTTRFTYRIGPILHDNMTLLMWDYNDHYRILQESGFTHGLKSLAAGQFFHPGEQSRIRRHQKELDDMLADGFRKCDYFNLPHFKQIFEKFPRISRQGTPIIVNRKKNVDANSPEAVKFLSDIAERTAALYQNYPALALLDVNSEIRDRSMPSFSEYEKAAFRKSTGMEIPPEVNMKTISYRSLRDFPPSRILSDKNPYLIYYRWFWKDGDGWNPMHTRISEIYHKHLHHPFRSYFAPAARQPPILGSGGKADLLGQWTYAYPDPLRLAAAADELQTVADGRPIMHGIQLICYRSQTAPAGRKVTPEPAWTGSHPDARYITIPPDSLIEAMWAALSRKMDGMVFHGDGSFYPPPIRGASVYIMTNPRAEPCFRQMVSQVIRPLGPTLKNLPESPRRVMILHSFSSAIFAERGTYGWGGWLMDLHLALQWGGLDPGIIYEEQLLRDRLKNVKVLVLSHCDILTEKVYEVITEFQKNGGIIVADETVPPAIMPNLRFHTFSRARENLEAKEKLTALGLHIREKLKGHYEPLLSSSSPDLIAHARGNCIFVINDKRTYGDYMGPWRLTAEKALPNSGKVTIRGNAGAVYDLVSRKPVSFASEDGTVTIPVTIPGAGGRLFMLLPEPLQAPQLQISPSGRIQAAAGGESTIPVQLEVIDSTGKPTDDCHFAAAQNGHFTYQLSIPRNAARGNWQIRFTVLPTGKTLTRNYLVP